LVVGGWSLVEGNRGWSGAGGGGCRASFTNHQPPTTNKSVPTQNDLARLPRLHQVEALLEVVGVQLMAEHLAQREARQHQLGHLVPGLVHAPAVDALHGQALEDDPVPVHARALGQDAEQGHLAAVVHRVEHVVEGVRVAAHLQTDVEAVHVQVGHHVAQRGAGDVDHAGRAHVGGELEPVVVDVGHHHVARADVLADARGHHPDRAGAGDQHVLANHVEFQRAVRGVAVGVEEGREFGRDLVGNRPQVGGRHDDVFGERAVAVDADADGVGAQVLLAGAAVAAVAADDVALGRHPLADGVTGDARPESGHAAHELVADDQALADGPLGPFVPEVDVQVGAADGGLLDPDQDLVRPWLRHRHLLHPDAPGGFALDQRLHRAAHGWRYRFGMKLLYAGLVTLPSPPAVDRHACVARGEWLDSPVSGHRPAAWPIPA